MTIKELIEKLKEFNGNEEVMIDIENEIEYDDCYISNEDEYIITDVIPDTIRNIVKLKYRDNI